MLELNLTDEQLLLMLETLSEKHMVLFMQRKDNSQIDQLIHAFVESLIKLNKKDIFYKVFEEVKK